MGIMQRNKGKRFERLIAKKFREYFPEFAEEIRRSIQSREAEESDVTGLPGFWVECQDAIRPTPLKKLEQAERDIAANKLFGEILPIAITHQKNTKEIYVTLRMHHLHFIFGHHINDYRYCSPINLEHGFMPHVSIALNDFLDTAKEYIKHVGAG